MDRNGYVVNGDGKYLVGVQAGEYSVVDGDEGILFDGDDVPNVSGDEAANLFDDEGVLTPGEGELGPIRIPTTAQSMNISQDGKISF